MNAENNNKKKKRNENCIGILSTYKNITFVQLEIMWSVKYAYYGQKN